VIPSQKQSAFNELKFARRTLKDSKPILEHYPLFRESGWQSGRELDFYPSNNPGSTPTQVTTTKKKIQKNKNKNKEHQNRPVCLS